MKKTLFTLIVTISISLVSNAQNMDWAKSFGSSGEDDAHSITADVNGNIYSTGRFTSTVDFDPGPGVTNLTSNGGSDWFIQKLDPNGNLLWVQSFGSAQDDYCYSIKTDASGNVYTTGYYWGTVDFDANAGTTNLTAIGQNDVFIQKIDPNGNLIWAKSFGGALWDFGISIDIDLSGNVFTTGYYTGTVDFDPGAGVLNLSVVGSADVFVQKLDSNGDFLWAKSFGGSGDDNPESIHIDSNGDIYITGHYSSTSVDFDPNAGTTILPLIGNVDVFIEKLDQNGDLVWAKVFGGSGIDYGYSIITDQSGNVYTTGYFLSSVDFDPNAGVTNASSNGFADVFLQKLDQSGNFTWVKTFGSANSEMGRSIDVDVNGNIYITGDFMGPTDFDPGAGTTILTSNGGTDAFVQKLDSNGDFAWARSFGGANHDFGRSISVDANDNVFTLGDFSGTADFDPNAGITNLTSNGLKDIFVQKMIQCVPVLNPVVPPNDALTVNCLTDATQPSAPVVTDECGTTISPVVSASADPACLGDKIYTFTYTDYIGNSSVYTYTYTIDDNILPTASNPAAINVECSAAIPAQDISVVSDAADNCTIPIVAWVGDVSDGNSCPEIITRTYSITDDCGNSITVNQIITVEDLTPPTASAPSAISVELISNVPAPDPLVVNDELDNCSVAPIVTWVGDVSDGNTCPEVITRTYSVTDDCGNSITVDQILTVNDVTPPTASIPAAINVECITDVPGSDPLVVTDEADNASIPVVAWEGDVSDGNTCPEVITRTYSITDDCGNQITVDQIITIHDVTLPSASNPATINVECAGDVPSPDVLIINDEIDNCTITPTVTFESDVSDGLTNPETITRTYSVEDDCGNSIDVIQLIVIQDVTPPTLDSPCISELVEVCEVTSLTPPTATDNCSGTVIVTHNATLPITSNTTITWTLEDANGNTVSYDQLITITAIDATTLTVNNGIVAMNSNADSYQWVDCNDNNSPIAGETGQTFSPMSNGSYAVEVTVGSCTETSICQNISTLGLKESNIIEVNLYPNPATSLIKVEMDHELEKIAIYDATGALIEFQFEKSFSIAHLSTGTYTAVIYTNNGVVRKRFIKS